VKKREAINTTLHIVVGAALAALVCFNFWFAVLATFIYAFLREQAQHRWILKKHMQFSMEPDFPVYTRQKQTFFGWITGHRIWEVFQWTLGAGAVCLGYQLIYV
jgi:hypothetical protein